MPGLPVLQQARASRTFREQARRRATRRRRARRTAAVLALGAAVLLVIATSVSGPAIPAPQRRVASTPRAAGRAPARPVYGRIPAAVQIHPRLQLPVRSGLLFDVASGRVMWQRDADRVLPIASLTKMMTALVAVAHSHASDRVLITRAALHYSGSGVGLLPLHKQVSERSLLYGLLLPSGNDAAIALAVHVAGTQRRFVAMMNAQARAMGLACTHFSNVSGVVDRDNHSCATDLAVIAHAVLTQPLLARIVASPHAVLRFPIKGGKLYLNNINPLLEAGYRGTDGVKTGYTTAAGMCIVAAARRGRHWLAVVLLHSGNWQSQAIALLNAGFAALRGA
jgi:serine-type D-Ala-D-Ala carboxypeptidase (penicillin-binding protein 5/6)